MVSFLLAGILIDSVADASWATKGMIAKRIERKIMVAGVYFLAVKGSTRQVCL